MSKLERILNIGIVTLGVLCLIFILMLGCSIAKLHPCQVKKCADVARIIAKEYGISASLILAVANVESGFDSDAVSAKGAVGLMQLMPKTAEWIGKKYGIGQGDLLDPVYNMRLAAAYLSYLLQDYSLEWALCAYNAGPATVDKWIEKGIALEAIPYAETRNYYKAVLRTAELYERLRAV